MSYLALYQRIRNINKDAVPDAQAILLTCRTCREVEYHNMDILLYVLGCLIIDGAV